MGQSSGGCRVGVGTGATAAARTDHNLQTQVGSWAATSGTASWTSATGLVQFAGSVLLMAGATVLMFHDIFSGVVIAAGKYAHVAYTLACGPISLFQATQHSLARAP
jgi:ethanolamine utilization microcompartment shell protein EutS